MTCCACFEGFTKNAKLQLSPRKVPISALILGTGPLGCGWAGDVSEEEAKATILKGISLGIRYVDSAPWYGGGLSEERVGRALAEVSATMPEKIKVSTKVGRYIVPKDRSSSFGERVEHGYDFNTAAYHSNIPVWDYRKDGISESFQQSQGRLQRSFIDCLRVHDAETPERWEEACGPDGGIKMLESLRAKGQIGEVSLGFNSAEYLLKTVRHFPVGTIDNIMIARTWNLLDTSAYGLLMECQRRGIKVHMAAIFCSGLLWGQNAFMYSSNVPTELAEKVKRWEELTTSFGLSLPAVAMAFAYLPTCVEKIAIGVTSPDQVEKNVALCDAEVPAALWLKAKELGLLPHFLDF